GGAAVWRESHPRRRPLSEWGVVLPDLREARVASA
ncbi:MAG: hypothetical protein ACI89X_001879, partial [Planctomycetota bacterium]